MRVVDLAHHPSDVLAGAALGIFAALVAARLASRWPPPAVELWGRPVATAASVGIPVVVVLTHGPRTLVVLLQAYIPLAIGVFLIVHVRRRAKCPTAEASEPPKDKP